MPFSIGETRRILFIEDQRFKTNNKPIITFTVSSESMHHRTLMREPNFRLTTQAVPIVVPDVHVDEQEFLASATDEEAYSKISSLFASLDINTSDKHSIGYSLVKKARILLRRNSGSGSTSGFKLVINVEMQLMTKYWWQGNVPATQSSISNLEIVRDADFSGEENCGETERSCSICLEEFNGTWMMEAEVKRMPCLHMFHGNCIDQWLNKSHYCPLCRFEMPASCIDLMHE
ncbi:RING/U-box superfamily protein [Euphorbia peplus]|nr:RING/U-box superfamily protein [Euphorbia peplus]